MRQPKKGGRRTAKMPEAAVEEVPWPGGGVAARRHRSGEACRCEALCYTSGPLQGQLRETDGEYAWEHPSAMSPVTEECFTYYVNYLRSGQRAFLSLARRAK